MRVGKLYLPLSVNQELVRALADAGHEALFLERNAPWWSPNRDLPNPLYGQTALYSSLEELKDCFAAEVRNSDQRFTLQM